MTSKKTFEGVTEHHLKKYKQVYKKGILKPETHHQLVEQLVEVGKAARIAPYWISSVSMTDDAINCNEAEVEYVQHFRKWKNSNVAGALYIGTQDSYQDRMNAMCGALIRNFIDARVMSAKQIVEALKKKDDIHGTVIFVPNFLLGDNQHEWADWDKSGFHDWVYQRDMDGKQTILGCKTTKRIKGVFGDSFFEYVSNHFMVMT